MKILILTHSYPDTRQKWRGLFIKEQASALSQTHDVNVVYFRVEYERFSPFGKYSFQKKSAENLNEYEVTVSRSLPVVTQLKYLIDTYRFIKTELIKKGVKPDLIHCHLSYPAGILGVITGLRLGIPVVLTEHTWIEKYFRSFIHKASVKTALRRAGKVVAVSEALRSDILKHVKRSIDVVPNVLNESKFPICLKEPGAILNAGLLGGMSNYRKGVDILIRAAGFLENKKVKFHIGGDGSLLHEFKKLADELKVSDHFVFHGEILEADIIKFYSSLDFYVLASRDETFGVVIIEAMSCGLPVVATRCGGPTEIITPGTGILAEKDNPADLARAIDNMSANIKSYNRTDISRYAATTFGREAFNRRITDIYNELLLRRAK